MGTFHRRMEIGVTILLSVSALGTSWSGYQASLWSGNQTELAYDASAIRTRATRAGLKAGLERTVDVALFTSWLEAYARHDTVYVKFLQRRFRREFIPAFEAWIATKPAKTPNAPLTPFAMSEYHLAADDSAFQLDRLADRTGNLAIVASRNGDAFVLNAVLFATAMVFGSVAQQENNRKSMRLTLVGLSTLMCLVALVRILMSPSAL